MKKKIGILALQGGFAKHGEAIAAAGAEYARVRNASELDEINGLIIPGGESTTIIKLLKGFHIFERIKKLGQQGLPLFGTCAGAILLAENVIGRKQESFKLIPIDIKRNAYGRQVNSFEADIQLDFSKPLFRAVFIRAPKIVAVSSSAAVLSRFEGDPLLVRHNNILAATFHPEMTGDRRVHEYFLSMID